MISRPLLSHRGTLIVLTEVTFPDERVQGSDIWLVLFLAFSILQVKLVSTKLST